MKIIKYFTEGLNFYLRFKLYAVSKVRQISNNIKMLFYPFLVRIGGLHKTILILGNSGDTLKSSQFTDICEGARIY